MLTKDQKECAEYYALNCLGKKEVESFLKCKWEELPKEFFEHIEITMEYNAWCAYMSAKIDEQIDEAQYLHE